MQDSINKRFNASNKENSNGEATTGLEAAQQSLLQRIILHLPLESCINLMPFNPYFDPNILY